jgi:predicted RNA-binding Zn-ribbon protein involved in translation (DUF1610 family)
MEKAKHVCPKCGGNMTIGNFTGQSQNWEKEGEHSFIKGEGRQITTYACATCGFLESYVRKA